ncbi:hypothetical protein KBD13_02075 [Patescibacteria group bacterium]|nr:hypothetical protein [Patescibacteria group bacterium]
MQHRSLSVPTEVPSRRSASEDRRFSEEIAITTDVVKDLYASRYNDFLLIAQRFLHRYTARAGGEMVDRNRFEALAEDSVQEAFRTILSRGIPEGLPEGLNTRARLYGYIRRVVISMAANTIRDRAKYFSVGSFSDDHDEGMYRLSNDDYVTEVRHPRMHVPTPTHMYGDMTDTWANIHPPSEEVAALEKRVDALRHMTDAALLYDYVLREGNVFGHAFTRGELHVTEENFERMKEILRMEAFGLPVDKKIQRLASLGMISQKDADDPAAYKRLKNLIHQTFHRAKEYILADMGKRDIFTPINNQK